MNITNNITITTFYLDMTSNQCGCPGCCPGNQPKFCDIAFFPSQLSEVENELRKLCEDVKEVYHETGFPQCPCLMFATFFLLFPVLCVMCFCVSKRKSRLDELIQNFNHSIGMFNLYKTITQGGREDFEISGEGGQKCPDFQQAVVKNYMFQALSGWGKNIGRGPWPFWPHSYPLLGATHLICH